MCHASFSQCDKDVSSFQNNVSFHLIPINISAGVFFLSSFYGMCQIILKFLKNKLAGIAKKILKMIYNQRRFAFLDIKCTQTMLIKTMWLLVQEHTVEWDRIVLKKLIMKEGLVHDELFNKL